MTENNTKMGLDISIKLAAAEDARLIAVLGAVTFYEAYYEQDTPIDIANYICDSFNAAKIAEELADPNSEFYIAYLSGSAVGYAKLMAGTTADGIAGDQMIEVKRLYTLERVWGKGVGESLLGFCVDIARRRGLTGIWLGVWEENARALRFYEKHGFRPVGTIKFPYGDTEGTNKVMLLKL